MADFEARDAESAAENPTILRLDSNPMPASIFMTSFSDVP